MPINASFEFERARIKYEQASSPKAKLEALLEMARTAPKHKGGENLRAEISRKIAKVKAEIAKAEQQAAKRGGGASIAVKKEGAGQVVLIGVPNSGKSTVLKALTRVDVLVADYPFSTTLPQMGMMDFKGCRVQLVEVPAIVKGSAAGKAQGTQLLALVRSADAVVLVVDALHALEEVNTLVNECTKAGVLLNRHRPLFEVKSGDYRGISVSGQKFLSFSVEDLELFLRTQGIHNAAVIIQEPLHSLQQVQEALDESLVYKKALVLLNWKGKMPAPIEIPGFQSLTFSHPAELVQFEEAVFLLLNKVLVFTKKPGEPPDLKEPLVLPQGSTVADLARMVHKDLARKLKHAKLYSENARFKGQKVPREYALQHLDIVEIEL